MVPSRRSRSVVKAATTGLREGLDEMDQKASIAERATRRLALGNKILGRPPMIYRVSKNVRKIARMRGLPLRVWAG